MAVEVVCQLFQNIPIYIESILNLNYSALSALLDPHNQHPWNHQNTIIIIIIIIIMKQQTAHIDVNEHNKFNAKQIKSQSNQKK